MKRMLKKALKALPVLILIMVFVIAPNFMVSVNGSDFPNETVPNNQTLTKTLGKTWATVATVVQIVSVACVVILGVRYMLASADQRADIKKGLIMVVTGSIFVFGAATVAKFIAGAGKEIIK